MPDYGIKGMRILVTASSAGIGYGIATVLARQNARIVVNGRNKDRLNRAVSLLRETGNKEVYGVQADIAVEREAELLVDRAVHYLGGLDALVYVTGSPPPGEFKDIPPDTWEHGISLLIRSAITLTRKALPHLQSSSNPSITYLTSIATKEPVAGLTLSNTLRIAVHGLAKTLSRELAPRIRVNTILPGYIMTDRLNQIAETRAKQSGKTPRQIIDEIAQTIPLKRIGTPEEIGHLVAFLISPYAKYITGTSIPVDGGLLHGTL